MTYPFRPLASAVLMAAFALLALTACASPFGGKPAAAKSPDPRSAMLAFTQCMRQHGIDMPDPNADGSITFRQAGPDSGSGSTPGPALSGGPGDPAFQAAQTACQKYMPNGGPGTMTPEDAKKAQENGLKFSQCMRKNGLPDFPDPQTTAGGGATFTQRGPGSANGSGSGGAISINGQTFAVDPSSPEFQKAMQACGSILGIKGGLPTTSGSGSSSAGG